MFYEAVNGIISIARAEPGRLVPGDTGDVPVGEWMLEVAANAALCDEPAAEQLRAAAVDL